MPADYIYDTSGAGLDGVHCMVAQSCRDPVATRSLRRLHDNVVVVLIASRLQQGCSLSLVRNRLAGDCHVMKMFFAFHCLNKVQSDLIKI